MSGLVDWHDSKIAFGHESESWDTVKIAYLDVSDPDMSVVDISPDILNLGIGIILQTTPTLRWSPDGRWIVVQHGIVSGVVDVFQRSFFDIQPQPIIPDWKNDSSHIIFAAYVYCHPCDGIMSHNPIDKSYGWMTQVPAHAAAYSPDDKYIAYANESDLLRMNFNNTGHTILANIRSIELDWASEGDKIAVASWELDEDGYGVHTGLHIIRADGGGHYQIAWGRTSHPKWRPITEDMELAYKFAPVLNFHLDDVYRPIRFELPLFYSSFVNDDMSQDLISPSTIDLLSSRWNKENTYINLLGVGRQQLRQIYNKVISTRAEPLIFARVVPYGSQGQTVIQYWLFYYDNPWVNHHEGDWEMVQVILGDSREPLYAVYSQHHGGSRRIWSQVEKTVDNRPIVYVANGSHANYFKPYNYYQVIGIDNAHGQSSRDDSSIQEIPPNLPNWSYFSGHWGDKGSSDPREQDGARSPGFQGDKWDDPLKWGMQRTWDETGIHNGTIKMRTTIIAPFDVHAYELPSGKHVGLENGIIELEINDAEYFDNTESRKRTILLHEVEPSYPNYEIVITCCRSDQVQLYNVRTNQNITFTIEFPDISAQETISATYVLSNTAEMPLTGTVDVHHGSNFILAIDFNGDGSVDESRPPLSIEYIPVDFIPPAPIADLSLVSTKPGSVSISWTATGDDGDVGAPILYDIRYHKDPITEDNWPTANVVNDPPQPAAAGTREIFTATEITGGIQYFAIRAIDNMFHHSELSNIEMVAVPYHKVFLPINTK